MSAFSTALFAHLKKDLRLELRARDTLATTLLFGVVLTMVLAFGLVADPQTNRKVFPAALWVALLFVGALAIGRTFAREARLDAFAAVVQAPAPRAAFLAAKLLGNVLLTCLTLGVVTPLLALLLRIDLPPSGWAMLSLQLLLGALGVSAVGTPMAVMAVNARFAEVLLPVVTFPMVSPILIAGVKGSGIVLGTAIGLDPWPWISFTALFDLTFGLGGLLLFGRMVEA